MLRWHGGKFLLADWIIQHFPPHLIYVEAYGGAGSVLLRKPRSRVEVYNDLDGRVVNVFRILQDRAKAEELARRIYLTPYARAEFDRAYEPPVDDIDDAQKLIVLSFFGFGSDSASRGCRTGFRAKVTGLGRALPSASWGSWHESIAEFVERLRGVTIESVDALALMRRYDKPGVLFYLDPPYLPELRTSLIGRSQTTHGYRHELDGGGHAELLDALLGLAGYVVLSGYPSPLYDARLSGWRRLEKQALADGARPRTEVLWLNPACAAALDREHAGAGTPLFREAAE